MIEGFSMPLRDHCRPPVKHHLPWDSLHSAWASALVNNLNTRWLPADFLALEHTHSSGRLEIDVATYERAHGPTPEVAGDTNGAITATVPRLYAPPAPAQTMPGLIPASFGIEIVTDGGWSLVAAIEFVSPGNKDRPDERRAFAAKCAGYLYSGVSLLIVDVVTDRRANLHDEIVRLMELPEQYLMPAETKLYAVSYRPVLREEKPEIDLWPVSLAVGELLPEMPLRLTGDLFVPIELEMTYAETCRTHRLV